MNSSVVVVIHLDTEAGEGIPKSDLFKFSYRVSSRYDVLMSRYVL
jgi:hypothetical protein